MNKIKVLSIIGARPQFIKLAPLSKAIRSIFDEIIVHTGQHYDINMSKQFFTDLNIPFPDYNLEIGSGTHAVQTGKMLPALEKVILHEKPSIILVFGDTNTTLAGALTGAKLNIPIMHIEAGLRSFNRTMPEEINRILTDHCSDYLCAPTQTAMQHLHQEGLAAKAFLTGDIMVDALENAQTKTSQTSRALEEYQLDSGHYYLLTLHRPYNVDKPQKLQRILRLLSEIDATIIFPIHPRTKQVMMRANIYIGETIQCIPPLGYIDFVCLQSHANKIITDSGGIQKEAFILGKPCITIRPETEWRETVETGWNLLLSPDSPDFADQIIQFDPKGKRDKIFGHQVAKRITQIIQNIFT